MPRKKRKPKSLDRLMYRARANKCIVNSASAYYQREMELRGFIDLFYPDMTELEIRVLVRKD